MAIPNDPKKPAQPISKPGVTPQKPAAVPPKAVAKPGAAPQKPAAKADGAGGKPPVKKPTAKAKGDGESGGRRKIGQVLIDLGFIDEDQLWEILDEARNTGQRTGEVALGRGLITDEQLLQVLAEQQGLKVVNLDEVKPSPEALAAVPETMATVYKVLPLTFQDKVLTVVVGDPSNLLPLDDLRSLLGCNEVKAVVAPPRRLEEAVTKAYSGKEESIVDLIQQLES